MRIAVGAGALGKWCKKNMELEPIESKDLPNESFNFVISFGTNYMKERKTEWNRLLVMGKKPINDGNIVQNCIIETKKIGKNNVFCNGCIIEHDSKIGNHNYISPAAVILSYVQIGDSNLIGANATVLPEIKIGNNCIIGAGAVVTKNVPNNRVVAGVPAKIIRSNNGRFYKA